MYVYDIFMSNVTISLPTVVYVRSEEHTSELQSRETISYAVFCLKKKKKQSENNTHPLHTTACWEIHVAPIVYDCS